MCDGDIGEYDHFNGFAMPALYGGTINIHMISDDSLIQNCKNKCPDGSDLPSGHFYLCCLHYSMGTIQATQA